MGSMSVLEIYADMPLGFVEALAGLFFLVLVGKFTHAESRVTMTAIAGCLAFPHAATLFAVGLLALVLRGFDFVNVVRGD